MWGFFVSIFILTMFNHSMIQFLRNRFMLVFLPRIVVFVFILLQIIAMLVYPGGTIHNEHSIGYSFLSNFFSDLGTYTSYNGSPNYLSMSLFIIGLTLVGITFSFFYLALPQLFIDNKVNYRFAILGSIFAWGGSIGLIGTGFTPADQVLDLHIFFANSIFECFMITALSYTIVIYRAKILEKKYAIGYGLFFILIALYVGVLEWGPAARSSQSALFFQVVTQKMIVLVFCLSIVVQTIGLSKIDLK